MTNSFRLSLNQSNDVVQQFSEADVAPDISDSSDPVASVYKATSRLVLTLYSFRPIHKRGDS